MYEYLDTALRLFAAFFLGAIIGLEREVRGKEAGFRTNSLVSLGSALFMLISLEVFEVYQGLTQIDPGRIAAQVVTGIGFLGAGAIIRSTEKIKGLTTAASIWVTAGIGMACGMGMYVPALLTTFFALLILLVFTKIEHIIRERQ